MSLVMSLSSLILLKSRSRSNKNIEQQFCQKKFDEQLIDFFVNVNISFRSVESSVLKQLIDLLRSSVKLSERTRFERMIKNQIDKVKAYVLTDLKSTIKISIALDLWTSSNRLAFLIITAYFIDKHWKFREVLLAFKSLFEQHSEENMIDSIVQTLTRYEITDRLLTTVIDNAGNNHIMRIHMFKDLQNLEFFWNEKTEIINCMTHVLQLIVNALLIKLKI